MPVCKPCARIRGMVPNTHVLVVGPATDPKLIMRALHEGADEFLDETAAGKRAGRGHDPL